MGGTTSTTGGAASGGDAGGEDGKGGAAGGATTSSGGNHAAGSNSGGTASTGGAAAGADAGSAGSNGGSAGNIGDAGAAGSAGDDTGSKREWALWPMPNPASAGLPRPANYDTTTNTLLARDLVTGLTWPRSLDPNYTEAAPARTKCQEMVFAGYDDWRLPTMIEMFSILDFTHTWPAINTAVFNAGSSSFSLLWTTSPNPFYPATGSWVMDFGTLSSLSTHPVNDRFPSHCVRGGNEVPSGPHYVLDDNTVLDTYTGLTWERNATLTTYEKAAAASYCDTLTLAGKDDWRLPSINETTTLYDFTSTRYPPMDAAAFPDDGSSVSTVDYWNAGGWTLSFWNLQIRKPNDARALRARCVR